MIIYHGTSEHAAREAMRVGLKPRAVSGTSNWTHTVESNPNLIYLTDTYGAYFALHAKLNGVRCVGEDGKISNRAAVIEIDTARLPFTNLRADEDYIAHAETLLQGGDIKENVRKFRDQPSFAWKDSLKHLGTCAYADIISPKHITRVAFFDQRQHREIAGAMMDASISLAGFRFAGHLHRTYTRWLFDGDVPAETFLDLHDGWADHEWEVQKKEFWDKLVADRSGIEIVTPNVR